MPTDDELLRRDREYRRHRQAAKLRSNGREVTHWAVIVAVVIIGAIAVALWKHPIAMAVTGGILAVIVGLSAWFVLRVRRRARARARMLEVRDVHVPPLVNLDSDTATGQGNERA